MGILLHIFQGLFALMAILSFLGFIGSRSLGILLGSLAYGAGAYASFSMDIWWPLGAAFVSTWILRLLGLDPIPATTPAEAFIKNGSQSYEGVSRVTSDETNTKTPQLRKKFQAKSLFVVPYEDMEGNLRRRWYGTMREARKGHAWFKKAQRHGHAQNLYPPMEQLVPEIDACPANKSELVEALNLSASYEDR